MYINKGKKISNALFLPAELERGTKVLKFDVCCKTIDQNSDWLQPLHNFALFYHLESLL